MEALFQGGSYGDTPPLDTGRDQCHREGPDEPPQKQANQDAGEEGITHYVVTMTCTKLVIPVTRPPGVARS